MEHAARPRWLLKTKCRLLLQPPRANRLRTRLHRAPKPHRGSCRPPHLRGPMPFAHSSAATGPRRHPRPLLSWRRNRRPRPSIQRQSSADSHASLLYLSRIVAPSTCPDVHSSSVLKSVAQKQLKRLPAICRKVRPHIPSTGQPPQGESAATYRTPPPPHGRFPRMANRTARRLLNNCTTIDDLETECRTATCSRLRKPLGPRPR